MMDERRAPSVTGHACREMNCAVVNFSHAYGVPGCDWVMLRDGTVISRREFEETSTRPDKLRK